MSNRFEFTLFNENNWEGIANSNEMSPKEIVKVFLKGLTICSYWMDTDELKALIQDHMDKEIY